MTPTSWLALGIAVLACAAPARTPARLRDLATRDRLAGSTGRSGHRRLAVSRLAGPLGAALGMFLMALVAWRFGPALGVAAGAVLAVGAVLVRDTLAARGEAARRAELRAAVRVLVSELAAGGMPGAALTAAAEVAPRYGSVLHAAARAASAGGDAADELRGDPDLRAVGLAWSLGQDTGAPLAEVLERVADDLAATDEQRRAVLVALSGPRSSAVLLAGLPVVGIALGASMGARPLAFLTAAGAGQLVCLLGVLLDAAGVMWMRRILRAAQRA